MKVIETIKQKLGIGKLYLMTVGDILPLTITFVVLGVVLAMGAYILAQVQNQLPTNSATTAAIENATKGITTFASWLPILAIIVIAAVVIGVILSSFLAPRRE
jgi:type II secretory pathway component PulF